MDSLIKLTENKLECPVDYDFIIGRRMQIDALIYFKPSELYFYDEKETPAPDRFGGLSTLRMNKVGLIIDEYFGFDRKKFKFDHIQSSTGNNSGAFYSEGGKLFGSIPAGLVLAINSVNDERYRDIPPINLSERMQPNDLSYVPVQFMKPQILPSSKKNHNFNEYQMANSKLFILKFEQGLNLFLEEYAGSEYITRLYGPDKNLIDDVMNGSIETQYHDNLVLITGGSYGMGEYSMWDSQSGIRTMVRGTSKSIIPAEPNIKLSWSACSVFQNSLLGFYKREEK